MLTCWVNGIDTESNIPSNPIGGPVPRLSRNSGVILMDFLAPEEEWRQTKLK